MDCLQLNDIINSSKNILLITHINPDGDTLGSMCAMYSAIWDNCKKKPDMLVMSDIPDNYTFLPYVNLAKHVSKFDNSREYNLVINLDVAAYNRMFESQILFDKAKYKVNIDHHITNDNYADLNLVEPSASSTGEFLLEIFEAMNWKISLNTAKCLYTAILTDTGSFRFNNTTQKTFNAAAKLTSIGVVPVEVYKYCYEFNTKEQIQFQAYCMNNAVFINEDKVAYIKIYKKDMERYGVAEDCTEGLTEKLRAIKSVEVAFIVKQISQSSSKISMRSEVADVSAVCAKFGGGGHKLAAGCLIKSSVEEATNKILEEVKNLNI